MDASLAISGEVDALGVTEFANEACDEVTVIGESYIPSPFTNAQESLQDLKAYFARPRLAQRGTIAFGTRARITFQNVNSLALSTIFPFYFQRLTGVYALRFTVCARLQVATTAFHQGMLALSFQYNSLANDSNLYLRGTQSATATNLPHVRMDLSELTMVELKVPFMYQAEMYPVSTGPADIGSYGHFNLNSILSLIAVSGLSAPTYEFYIWLEDLEFFGACNNAVTPITLQSGKTVKGKGVAAKEESDKHLLSNTLKGVAKISRFVGDNIPILASFAGTTAWAADLGSGVARMFGYSRPLVSDALMRIQPNHYVSETNVDVPFSGFAVGPMQSNTLTFDGVFGGTNVDEMSLKFVLSQWSQVCVGAISTTDTHAKTIYACNTGPNTFWFRAPATAPYCNIFAPVSGTSTTNAIIPSHLFWWASMFRSYRGGFDFKFTFAKTKFHGGRYIISWHPNVVYNSGPGANAQCYGPELSGGLVQPYGYSMICDLRDGNEFEFSIPYLAPMPYLNYHDTTGYLTLTCIDPLQANSTVSATVPFMVEVRGGSDFEPAVPRGLFYSPHVGQAVIYQQSGKVVSATQTPNQHTIGEEIVSIKQLIQMPHWHRGFQASGNITTYIIFPWWYYRVWPTVAPIPITQTYYGYGRIGGACAQSFVWARGSTDFHAYVTDVAGNNQWVQHLRGDKGGSGSDVILTQQPGWSSTPKVVATGGQAIHARMPAYQAFLRIPTWALSGYDWFTRIGTVGVTGLAQNWFGTLLTWTLNTSGGATEAWAGTAAGDDAMLAGYMGPAPVMMPNSVGTNFLDPDWGGL